MATRPGTPNRGIPARAQTSEAIASRLILGLSGAGPDGDGAAAFPVRPSGGAAAERDGALDILLGDQEDGLGRVRRDLGAPRRAHEYEPQPARSPQQLW